MCTSPPFFSTHAACRAGTRPEQNTVIVIGETDYNSYAVIYYQKRGKMTVKLYGGPLMHALQINALKQQQCLSFSAMFCVQCGLLASCQNLC